MGFDPPAAALAVMSDPGNDDREPFSTEAKR